MVADAIAEVVKEEVAPERTPGAEQTIGVYGTAGLVNWAVVAAVADTGVEGSYVVVAVAEADGL
jgi:hypothetical protein